MLLKIERAFTLKWIVEPFFVVPFNSNFDGFYFNVLRKVLLMANLKHLKICIDCFLNLNKNLIKWNMLKTFISEIY